MGPRREAVPCQGDPLVEEEEGEATCLLAVAKWGWQPSTCLRMVSSQSPSAHPLWDISSPGEPVTLTVVHLVRPPIHGAYTELKMPLLTSVQGCILGHSGAFKTVQFSFSYFKVIPDPKALHVRMCYKSSGLTESSHVANRQCLDLLPLSSYPMFSELKTYHGVLWHR